MHNSEDSKFTSAIGSALWETEQMGSNCRPVVGTLLTNAQVAVYRAFWNQMWLGSWGRPSNYQHLSFLFNEGECGKRLARSSRYGERCQGHDYTEPSHSFGGQVSPCHLGACLPFSWESNTPLGEWVEFWDPWVSTINHCREYIWGTLIHHVYYLSS